MANSWNCLTDRNSRLRSRLTRHCAVAGGGVSNVTCAVQRGLIWASRNGNKTTEETMKSLSAVIAGLTKVSCDLVDEHIKWL